MKVFVISAHDAHILTLLFPCKNRPSSTAVVAAGSLGISSGGEIQNKVYERYYRLENAPHNVALTVTFPPKDSNRPQVWSLRAWPGFAETRVTVEEEETQFVVHFSTHRAPFFFPKAPMFAQSIEKIRAAMLSEAII